MLKKLIMLFLIIISFTNCSRQKIVNEEVKLNILPRTSWNANPPKDFLKHNPDRVTIHHEGTYFSQDSLAFRHIKNIQLWGMREKKWADVPYHFFIDGFGNIIEGRDVFTVGETSTSYDPTGHILISIIGEYQTRQQLNKNQYRSLLNLLTYLCKKYNIPPDLIKGHRDYCKPGETNCPGENIYKFIRDGKIIFEVKKNLGLD